MRSLPVVLVSLLLSGCWIEDWWNGKGTEPADTGMGCVPEAEIPYDGLDQDCDGADLTDFDGDGWDAVEAGGYDCIDTDASVYPGAPDDWYDGVDADCAGDSDFDQDLDGYDTVESGGEDCDDLDEAINPEAVEVCDGVDQDCDGAIDDDASDGVAYWQDTDLDGYGDEAAEVVVSCEPVEGLVLTGGDCDDADAAINPEASEVFYDGVDQDCDGASDYDADQDGYDALDFGGDDCDDEDAAFSPAAAEVFYDGVDQDCDGASDYDQDMDGHDSDAWGGDDCLDTDAAAFPGAPDTWYDGVDSDCAGDSDYDQDADGFDASAYGGADCGDTDAAVHPGAAEVYYDGVDQDCDGLSDYDQDLDGYDALAYGGADCDDTDAAFSPAAAEVWYDGNDQDCDGASDYDQDTDGHDSDAHGGDDCLDTDAAVYPGAADAWYDGVDADCAGDSDYDQDGDGEDWVLYDGTDCDDTDPTVLPGAVEVYYDGTDQDCDGLSDYDADLDGYDSADWGGTDCDDDDIAVNPDASERWYDGVDQDCDGLSDFDQDGDGDDAEAWGGPDCDDVDAAVHPGAVEVYYDGNDQDCDGASDYDADLDGVDSSDWGGADCDDLDPAVLPGAAELWYDGVDQDCDGLSDYDQDGDGYDSDAYGGSDCLDTDAGYHPGAADAAHDGLDTNCNGLDGPVLSLGASSGSIAALEDYPAAGSVLVAVTNDGDGALAWSASASEAWVTFSATSGSGDGTVTLGADPSGLADGDHSAVVTFTDADTGDTADLTLALTVVPVWEGTATTTLARDAKGQVVGITEPTGEVLTLSYDGLGHVTDMSAASGAWASTTWDRHLPVAFDNDEGTLSVAYTDEGYVEEVTFPDGATLTGSYDSSGRLDGLTLPSGAPLAWDYSASQGLLPDETSRAGYGTVSTTFDADGRVLTRTIADGTVSTWAWDAVSGQPASIVHEDARGNLLIQVDATYDARLLAEEVTLTDASGSVTTTYAYDAAGRLISAISDDGTSLAWAWDAAGNRTSATVDGLTAEALYDSDGRLLQQGEEVFTYDAAGRMTSRTGPDGQITYAWDAFGRLVEVDSGSHVVTHTYAGDGTRLSREADGVLTTYYYDRSSVLPRLVQAVTDDGGGTSTASFLWGATGLEAIDVDGTAYGVLPGRLGTVLGLKSGPSLATWAYDPFGVPTAEPALVDEAATWFAFTGEERDPVTGLVYLRSRWYDPSLGRFISPDSQVPEEADPSTWNAYLYVGGDPVNFVDPAGTVKWWGVIGGVAAVLTGVAMIATGGTAIVVLGALTLATGKVAIVTNLILPSDAEFTCPASPVDWASYVAQQVVDDPTTKQIISVTGTLTDIALGGIAQGDAFLKLSRIEGLGDMISHIAQLGTLTSTLESFLGDYAGWLHENDKARWDETFGPDSPLFGWTWPEQDTDTRHEDPGDERGGIYLNESARLMGSLTQLDGAFMDPRTGQLVLYGADGGYAVDGLDENDLMVALQWAHDSMETGLWSSPGVTIEPDLVPTEEPEPPDYEDTYHGVGYFGGVEYSYPGWVLFESDRLLKCLGMGVDNEDPTITYDFVKDDVAAFAFGREYFADYYDGSAPSGWVRWWLEPQDMILSLDPTREAFVFDTATMEVLYEDEDDPSQTWPYADAWTTMLTANYDDIAVALPVWDELRTFAKAVALVYMLDDQGIAAGLNWDYIDAYAVEAYDTPWWTREGSITYEITLADGTVLPQSERGGALAWDSSAQVMADDSTGTVTARWDDILASRPDDTTNEWTFAAADGTSGTAVALPLADAGVRGDHHRVFDDLRVPAPGALPLAAFRTYSSVRATQGLDQGMGPGWSLVPWSLRVSPLVEDHGSYGTAPANATFSDHLGGHATRFVYEHYSSGQAVFLSPDSADTLTWDESAGLFTLTQGSHLVQIFDADGRLLQVLDPVGNSLDYTWSSDALALVEHSGGSSFSYAWNGDGTLGSITADSGRSVSYAYGADGLLAGFADVGGNSWTYTYSDGLLASIAGPDGSVVASASYDDWGRLVAEERLGQSFSQQASLLDGTLTVTDGAGVSLAWAWDDDGHLETVADGEGGSVTLAYDSDGQLVSVTDALGDTTTATYRSDGTLWKVEDAEGDVTQTFWTWSGTDWVVYTRQEPDGRQLYYHRDSSGLIDAIYEASFSVSADGTLSGLSWSGGPLAQSTWDAQGGLTHWEKGDLAMDLTLGADGQPTAVTHPGGFSETLSYDADGQLLSVVSAAGQQASLTYDAAFPDQIATLSQGGDLVQSWSYDALGRLTAVTDAEGNATSYSYGADGALAGAATPDGGWLAYEHDGGGRLIGVSASWGLARAQVYDAAGRLVQHSREVVLP